MILFAGLLGFHVSVNDSRHVNCRPESNLKFGIPPFTERRPLSIHLRLRLLTATKWGACPLVSLSFRTPYIERPFWVGGCQFNGISSPRVRRIRVLILAFGMACTYEQLKTESCLLQQEVH